MSWVTVRTTRISDCKTPSSSSSTLISSILTQHYLTSQLPRQPSIRFQSSDSQPTSLRPSLYGRPFRFAICGAGPAGFYSASRLLSLNDSSEISVDLFEALPAPFGLSRYGVAPDHPEVKNCEKKFEEVAQDYRFRYFGNTQLVGTHSSPSNSVSAEIQLDNLRKIYDAVVLAYGAGLDRSLGGIPGEFELQNILPARRIVNWYNGHPSSYDQPLIDLSQVEHVTIIGQGNVALDLARILLTDIDRLAKTDISERALQALAESRVKHVDIVGRRGPLQVSFTTKELRELLALEHLAFDIDPQILLEAVTRLNEPGVLERMNNGRLHKRILDLLIKAQQKTKHGISTQSWSLKFLQTPIAFCCSSSSRSNEIQNNKVSKVIWEKNELRYPCSTNNSDWVDLSSVKVTPINPIEKIESKTDLVIKSVGFRSTSIDSIPFDKSKSCVLNRDGRVIEENGKIIPGLYVTGWCSHEPNGVIAKTMYDSFQTIDNISKDLKELNHKNMREEEEEVEERRIGIKNIEKRIDWKQWKSIDEEERRRGQFKDKIREKIVSVDEMLKVGGVV